MNISPDLFELIISIAFFATCLSPIILLTMLFLNWRKKDLW